MNLWNFGKEAIIHLVANRLAEAPGVPAKAAQLLALKAGLKNEGAKQLPSPKAMADKDVLKLLAQYSPHFLSEVDQLLGKPKVASLGQVHRARLKNGKSVVFKIQFPNLEDSIESQVTEALKAFAKFGPYKNSADEQALIKFEKQIKNDLFAELNYKEEAKRQNQFKKNIAHIEEILIPLADENLTTHKVLVQEEVNSLFLPQKGLVEFEKEKLICELLTKVQLTSLFTYGDIHGDLHPGNWGLNPESQKLVLYDFGHVLHLSLNQIKTIEELIATPRSDSYALVANYIQLGFDNIWTASNAHLLADITDCLFLPLRCGEQWSKGTTSLSTQLENILGQQIWNFRMSGPSWLMPMIRAWQGPFYTYQIFNYRPNFLKYYNELGKNSLPNSHSDHSLSINQNRDTDTASKLHVLVKEKNEEIVNFEMPANAAERLEEIIPREVAEKIIQLGINLSEISEKVKKQGAKKGRLFEAQTNDRNYKVWLE